MMIQKTFDELPTIPQLPLRRHELARAAVVALFRERNPGSPAPLQTLPLREWKALLYWLDTSGLALYLLDRLQEPGLLSVLPDFVRLRLEQNLRDNTERTAALIDDCCTIQKDFVEAGISYAVLKGFSLWPQSVPRLELRSQLDLDFLVARGDESLAKVVLERRGYRLHGVSGRSREFKTPYSGPMTIAGLYRPSPQRTVEVHLEEQKGGLLSRCEHHTLRGVSMPVLSAADLFLDQALHLYKHLSRDQMRCSHLLELYRHLQARSGDSAFWARVDILCAPQPAMASRVGLALEFVSQQMEPSSIPITVRRCTIDHVPLAARLWVRRYGAGVTTAGFPGTKLNLLLQQAMVRESVPVMSSLLPRRLPPAIEIPPVNEAFSQALRRELRQGWFILMRMRFHVREGLRYLLERRRWSSVLRTAGVAAKTAESAERNSSPVGSFGTATKP